MMITMISCLIDHSTNAAAAAAAPRHNLEKYRGIEKKKKTSFGIFT